MGEESPPVPSPPPQRGGGRGRPLRKLCRKTAHRYKNHTSLHTVLHGSDVIVCPSSNRGTHRRRWRRKTCACRGEARGGRTREGGGDGAGGNHHGTRQTGGSFRQRLLRMWAPVVVQDHAVRLLGGGPQLHILSVSGAVRQHHAPDPAGPAESDANKTRGRRGAAEGETAMGVTKREDETCAGRGDGDADDETRASRGNREAGERGDDGQLHMTVGHTVSARATSHGG